jgi:hypothetical protein
MREGKPTVDETAEFLEISNDFTNPKEIIREAVSNAFDARSKTISIAAFIDKTQGNDELVIAFRDDGDGMDENGLAAFFGLGKSTRRIVDTLGNKASTAIGEKGHGSKIYFNSRRIEVSTVQGKQKIVAFMEEPLKNLRQRQLPLYLYDIAAADGDAPGTEIKVIGYNRNNQRGFSHDELRDYIYWSTKFGSTELEFGINTYRDTQIHLIGLGRSNSECINFGHRFPAENTDVRSLRRSDKVSPLDYYVAKWVFPQEPLDGVPNSKIDFVFVLEGDQAKREYNRMIHEKYAAWIDGQYRVEDRYGLWLCKDFIPIVRKNDWVAERSEWTKYHAFVNSQDFCLTANRGDLENTPAWVMEAIEKTVRRLFNSRIKTTENFQRYSEELQKEEMYRSAEQEERDFERRKRSALKKEVAELDSHILFAPRQESGVFSLFLQVATLRPDAFNFKIVDYDTAMGYDLLVTKDYQLDLNRAALRFVEMK